MVYKWIDTLSGMLYPPVCALCDAAGDYLDKGEALDLCAACRQDLVVLQDSCRGCGLPLPRAIAKSGTGIKAACGQCLQQPPAFDACYSLFEYAPPLSRLLHGFKYQGKLAQGQILAALFARYIKDQVKPMPEIIIPVPLHKARLRERGFNQATEIGRYLARYLAVPIAYDICERHKPTQQQSGLSAVERRANLRQAFRLRQRLVAKHIALVDDVMTTGATINALARLLKQQGAESVQAWVVARTLPE